MCAQHRFANTQRTKHMQLLPISERANACTLIVCKWEGADPRANVRRGPAGPSLGVFWGAQVPSRPVACRALQRILLQEAAAFRGVSTLQRAVLRLQWELLADIEQVNKAQLGKSRQKWAACEAAFPEVSLTRNPPPPFSAPRPRWGAANPAAFVLLNPFLLLLLLHPESP